MCLKWLFCWNRYDSNWSILTIWSQWVNSVWNCLWKLSSHDYFNFLWWIYSSLSSVFPRLSHIPSMKSRKINKRPENHAKQLFVILVSQNFWARPSNHRQDSPECPTFILLSRHSLKQISEVLFHIFMHLRLFKGSNSNFLDQTFSDLNTP